MPLLSLEDDSNDEDDNEEENVEVVLPKHCDWVSIDEVLKELVFIREVAQEEGNASDEGVRANE